MKNKLIFFTLFFALISCDKPKVFVLKDPDNAKFYLSGSVTRAFKKGYIDKAPLVAIDGVPFGYQKNLDTIILPLAKDQITSINILSKKSSPVIYGLDANDGAVVINTTALPKYTTDTVRTEDK